MDSRDYRGWLKYPISRVFVAANDNLSERLRQALKEMAEFFDFMEALDCGWQA